LSVWGGLVPDGFDASEDGTGRGTPIIPILEAGARTGKSTDDIRAGIGIGEDGDPMFTLQSGKQHAVAFHENQRGELTVNDTAGSLKVGGGKPGQGYPAIAIRTAQTSADGHGIAEDVAHTLDGAQGKAVACNFRGREHGTQIELGGDVATAMRAGGGTSMAVRRLTPRECERLMGLPDDYTLIPYNGKMAADGPRYKAIGNGMAVPVLRWIGERIQAVEALSVRTEG